MVAIYFYNDYTGKQPKYDKEQYADSTMKDVHCNTLLIHVNGNGSIVKREHPSIRLLPSSTRDIYEDVRDLCMSMLV